MSKTLGEIVRDNMFAEERLDGESVYGFYHGGGQNEHFIAIPDNWLEVALNDTTQAILQWAADLVGEDVDPIKDAGGSIIKSQRIRDNNYLKAEIREKLKAEGWKSGQ